MNDTLHEIKSRIDSSYGVSFPTKPIMETFEPFIHDGFVSLTSDLSKAIAVKILKDTGASQSLLLADALPFSEKSSAGVSVLIKNVDSSDYTPVPLHVCHQIDPFKDNAAILPGVQNYWGECAAKHKLQMVDSVHAVSDAMENHTGKFLESTS